MQGVSRRWNLEYRRCLPAKSFVWSCPGEKVRIDAIEIGKVRVYLQHPIALSENDGADINTADCGAKEWLVLEPCNNVVKSPRHNHASRSRGKIPAVAWRLEEDEEAIRNGNDKLSSHRWSARERRSIDQVKHRTSMRMSLCRSTFRRIFATVSIIMNTNVPTIMPCDHASSVKCAGSEGFAGRGFSMMAEATPLE